MVEGETLLVLLLLGRWQQPATAPQPGKKGAADASDAMVFVLVLLGPGRFSKILASRGQVKSEGPVKF